MVKDLNILLIDDEDHLQEVLGLLLEIEGHNIATAYTGGEALEKAKSNKYDLIITDLKMPGMSGMEVIKNFKLQNPDTKIIMITGFPAEEVEKKARQYGADEFIAKPFHMDKMREAINKIFGSEK